MGTKNCLLAIGVALLGAGHAGAEVVTFTIQPAESELTLSGQSSFYLTTAPYVAQGEGSLRASYSGTIVADITPTTIQFLPGTVLIAGISGTWRPSIGGSTVGDPATDPANYGYTMDVLNPDPTVAVAIRGLEFSLTHDAPIPLSLAGFSSAGLQGVVTAGTADTDRGNPPQTDLRYTDPWETDFGGNATLTLDGDSETLRLPLQFATVLQNVLYSESNFLGEIVAVRAVPEPVGAVLLIFGAGLLSVRRRPLHHR